MFNCSMCKKPSQPGTPATMVVVETRPKVYHNYHQTTHAPISTTTGEEIVKEQLVCSTCAPPSLNAFNSMQPALEFLAPGVASRGNLPTYQDYIPDGTP